MKHIFTTLKIPYTLALLLMVLSLEGWGQITVFTDNFSTENSATWTTSGLIGVSDWSVSRSGADWGARRNTTPEQLELTNDVGATTNANGWVFASVDATSSFDSPYNTTLSSNIGLVTWTFNMRQIRTDPAGYAAGSYGAAFIIAGSTTTPQTTGSGYAIVYGQSGTTDPVRLATYNNGFQGTLTNIITSNTSGLTDFGAEYLSVKVTYTPSTNTWELFLRNDGASAFADPESGSLTTQGTVVNSTYTGTSLGYMGGYWQGSTGGSQTAFFDNIAVKVNYGEKISTAGGGNWNTAATWSPSGVPNLHYNVTISNGSPVIISSDDVTCNNLTIGATSSLTINQDKELTVNGTLTNNAGDAGLVVASGGSLIHSTASVPGTVQRSITAAEWGVADDGWHLISSPVASQNIDGSWTPAGAGNGYDFYAWSEATNTWLNQKVGANNITAFEVGRGYIAAYEQTSTKAFTGNLNVANQTFTDLSYTPAQGNGWHLLGNPFASAIKWNDGNWALTAVAGTAKIWNESTRSYTDLLANAHIPVNNGFMVQVSNGTNSITIPILAREHNATAFYKSTDAFEGIKLIAAPSDLSSAQELVIRTDGQATNGFDFYTDSRFLPGGAPHFYSVAENEQLSTNSLLSISPEMTINLGFMKKNHEVNTITLVENTLADNLYLTDLKLNFTQKISENPVYSFTSAQGDDPNRFLLQFGAVGVDEAIPATAIEAYVSNNMLYVMNAQGKVQTDVIDVSGRLVFSQSMLASGLSSTPLNLPAGVYVVRISNGLTSRTNKVIVQ
ncbi:MAG: T9SS type A sorting domain-containing protein [Bacteroidales bacterium]|nr:T9SS type A sorting domain-containing protein [Bacteroidales bacterium]